MTSEESDEIVQEETLDHKPPQSTWHSVDGLRRSLRQAARRARSRIMDPDGAAAQYEVKASCIRDVELVFPDIEAAYLDDLAGTHGNDSSAVLNHVMDQEQNGERYPRRPKISKRKRKRPDEEEGDDIERQLARARQLFENHPQQQALIGECMLQT